MKTPIIIFSLCCSAFAFSQHLVPEDVVKNQQIQHNPQAYKLKGGVIEDAGVAQPARPAVQANSDFVIHKASQSSISEDQIANELKELRRQADAQGISYDDLKYNWINANKELYESMHPAEGIYKSPQERINQ